MNIGKACGIFKQIESDKYTDIEKTIAIDSVLNMETHNGVTKDEILRAFKWFLNSERAGRTEGGKQMRSTDEILKNKRI